MSKPIRGLENMKIGKEYEHRNKEYGVIRLGKLKFIEFCVGFIRQWHMKPEFQVRGNIIPKLIFEDGSSIYATDCGVIPYHYAGYNTYNTLHEI